MSIQNNIYSRELAKSSYKRGKILMSKLFFTFVTMLCLSTSYVFAGTNNTALKAENNAGIIYDGNIIHPGCVQELITELNGDDIVSSVNISRTQYRGCMDSNMYSEDIEYLENDWVGYRASSFYGPNGYEQDEHITFSYKIIEKISKELYLLRTDEFVDGSMRSHSDTMVVQLKNEPFYQYDDGKLEKTDVTRLKKIADISNKDMELFLKQYKAGDVRFDTLQ